MSSRLQTIIAEIQDLTPIEQLELMITISHIIHKTYKILEKDKKISSLSENQNSIDMDEKLKRLKASFGSITSTAHIPDIMLSRESLYGENER